MGRMVTARSRRHDTLAAASASRARLAESQAKLVELKAAKLRGELLDAAEVERESGGCCGPCGPRCWPFRPASAPGCRI